MNNSWKLSNERILQGKFYLGVSWLDFFSLFTYLLSFISLLFPQAQSEKHNKYEKHNSVCDATAEEGHVVKSGYLHS